MAKTFSYIRASGIKKLVKEKGRRSGVDFLEGLDNYVRYLVEKFCATSETKTLGAEVLNGLVVIEETETKSVETVTEPVEEEGTDDNE